MSRPLACVLGSAHASSTHGRNSSNEGMNSGRGGVVWQSILIPLLSCIYNIITIVLAPPTQARRKPHPPLLTRLKALQMS